MGGAPKEVVVAGAAPEKEKELLSLKGEAPKAEGAAGAAGAALAAGFAGESVGPPSMPMTCW